MQVWVCGCCGAMTGMLCLPLRTPPHTHQHRPGRLLPMCGAPAASTMPLTAEQSRRRSVYVTPQQFTAHTQVRLWLLAGQCGVRVRA
jgi:hypothetical protein